MNTRVAHFQRMSAVLLLSLVVPLVAHAETKSYLGIREINLDVAAGNLQFVKSSNEELILDYTKKEFSDRCSLDISQDGSRLQVSITKPFFGSHRVHCEVEMVVNIPEQAALVVSLASGKMTASDISSPVRLNGASADIDLNGQFDRLEAASSSGRILARGFWARESSLSTVAGSIDIQMDGRKSASLTMKTVSGDAYLTSEIPVHAEFNSVSGALRREVVKEGNDQSIQVKFKSVSGNLVLK